MGLSFKGNSNIKVNFIKIKGMDKGNLNLLKEKNTKDNGSIIKSMVMESG